ncbi:MAG: hypothetical protein EAZ94_02145 [Oscillatoriales cyanobacterium]|nr:MAG: hypothetical protein EAZ94_02145 [Oscillatoriales cyanobacterium]TAE27971.1 MAG: hypothetical protein EAZ93_04245 [Oscillatoriales cyanobacterium]
MAIATKMDGVPGPLSGQFSNWPFEGVFGVGDCGIETRQNVANCNVFRTYATAVGKPGQFRNFLLKGATAFFERTAKILKKRTRSISVSLGRNWHIKKRYVVALERNNVPTLIPK